jgi:hypothetical protein
LNPESVNLSAIGSELAYVERAYALLKSAKKAFEDRITSEIKAGRPVKGWQIGRTPARRYWSGTVEDLKAVEMMTGETLTEEKPISLTEAWAKSQIRPFIEPLLSKGEGSEKLIPFNATKTKEIFKND